MPSVLNNVPNGEKFCSQELFNSYITEIASKAKFELSLSLKLKLNVQQQHTWRAYSQHDAYYDFLDIKCVLFYKENINQLSDASESTSA